jgi:oligopeptide transport system ATP-binding protein
MVMGVAAASLAGNAAEVSDLVEEARVMLQVYEADEAESAGAGATIGNMVGPSTNFSASGASSGDALLQVIDLQTHFPIRRGLLQRVVGHVKAVDGVSFRIGVGETLGLVGESGCGKTTVGRSLLKLIPATGGRVLYRGESVFDQPAGEMRRLRREMQIIFQDPAGSLNPRMRVASIVGEPLEVHGIATGEELRDRVEQLLVRCGLWKTAADRYPHEFSGGQRQRIGIARALALEPKLIVCDEPTSALDVSIQSQILNLLKDLQEEFGLSYLFISHDMAVIHHICDRVAVMYDGRIVEEGDRDTIINRPTHPYTQALLSAVPEADPRRKRNRIRYEGMRM